MAARRSRDFGPHGPCRDVPSIEASRSCFVDSIGRDEVSTRGDWIYLDARDDHELFTTWGLEAIETFHTQGTPPLGAG